MIKRSQVSPWRQLIFDNGSYKLVAVFVTLILWVTNVGKRDFTITKTFELDYQIPRSMKLKSNEVPHKVSVRVSGTRMTLRKFSKSSEVMVVDLSRTEVGPFRYDIKRSLDVPVGVKVISVSPEYLNVVIEPRETGTD